jgi:hypothetical protein
VSARQINYLCSNRYAKSDGLKRYHSLSFAITPTGKALGVNPEYLAFGLDEMGLPGLSREARFGLKPKYDLPRAFQTFQNLSSAFNKPAESHTVNVLIADSPIQRLPKH